MASNSQDPSTSASDTGLPSSTNTKIFNDPIHGSIELQPLCVKVIDTPQFQRLRNIKQLGGCYMVYPGGGHNRFEHSIGTCYLAGEMIRTLQQKQPELNITDEDILCVEIAGLCHDLGHGPFSHLFDQSFIPAVFKNKGKKRKWTCTRLLHNRYAVKVGPTIKWTPALSLKHEDASKDMFDHLIKENGLEDDFKRVKQDIKDLIDGKENKASSRWTTKPFLYEIVANKRNGIDVDKWDYFARDCHSLGIRNNFDHGRLMKFARVISVEGGQQICYRDKEAANLYEMFHTRMNLHRRAYQHRVNKLIEEMITDALLSANEHIFLGKDRNGVNMSEAIDNMEAYCQMTDCILQQILVSNDKNLKESQAILAKIQKRELYKPVGKLRPQGGEKFTKVLKDILERHRCSGVKAEDLHAQVLKGVLEDRDFSRSGLPPTDLYVKVLKDILEKHVNSSVEEDLYHVADDDAILRVISSIRGCSSLKAKNLYVQIISLNYGNKSKNPIDNVRFYTKEDPTKAESLPKDKVSLMLPREFSKQIVYLYCKDDGALEEAKQCFEEWCEKNS